MAGQPHRGAQPHPLHQFQAQRGQIHDERAPISTEEDGPSGRRWPCGTVRYRCAASIVPRPAFEGKANRSSMSRPCRRIREANAISSRPWACGICLLLWRRATGAALPLPVHGRGADGSMNLFTPGRCGVTKRTKIQMSLFHAVMENGVIQVPPYDSPEVLKGGSSC